MSALSDYSENALLNHLLGGPDFVRPANVSFALSLGTTTDAGGISEPGAGGYSRVQVANNVGNFPAAASGVKTLPNSFQFPTATANWGTVSHAALYDALSGGNMLWHTALAASASLDNGGTAIFPANSVSFSLTGTSGLGDGLKNALLNHFLGGPDYTRPTTLYAALSTTTITGAGSLTEPSGGAYARVAVTNNVTNFPAAASGAKSCTQAIQFPTATANWGNVIGVAFFDAPTAGNLIAYVNRGATVTINSGNTAIIPANTLQFSLA